MTTSPSTDISSEDTRPHLAAGPKRRTVDPMDPATKQSDVLLAAAHHFLSAERLVTELNVLSIVGLTGLESTAKTADELGTYIRKHTGVRPKSTVVEHAVEVLVRAGLVEPIGQRWAATRAGREQVEQSLQWAATSRTELERAVGCAAEEHGTPDARVAAPQLTDVLLKVLEESLFTAIVADARGVEKVGEHLVPKSLDLAAMVARSAELLPTDPDAQHVLGRLLRRAISPADGFAAVQVTDLVTAALIHLVIAHQDEAVLRKEVGSLAGVTIVVDTPIALLLLAEPEVVASTEQVLKHAVECGVYLRFGPTLGREVSSCVRGIGSTALRDKVDDRFHLDDLELVLDVIEGDGILNSYVRGRWAGQYQSWDDFESAAKRVPERMRQMGAREISFPRDDDSDVVEFYAEHNRTIARRNIKDPGTRSALADARLMALLQRARKKQPTGVWPAAWSLSPDTHVPETYRAVAGERESATITLGQLGALLLRFAEADTRVTLARAASGTLRREALYATSARVSPAVRDRLIEIASNPDIPLVDRKKIQRGVAGVLDRAESETDIETVIATVTNQVLADAGSEVRRRYEVAIRSADARASQAVDSAAAEKRRADEIAEQLRESTERDERHEQELAAIAGSAKRDRQLWWRERILAVVMVVFAGAALTLRHWAPLAIGSAAVWQAGVLWGEHIRDGSARPSWPAIAIAAGSGALAVKDLL